jgi:3-hydroxyacyl-CoA dehydrogenase
LGRKSGGGFYRVVKQSDGAKLKQVYDLASGAWRRAETVALAPPHDRAETLLFADDAEGRFGWDLIGGTLLYAADLIPEIADDIVNVDRALRWGFAWKRGPFELLDAIGPARVIARLEAAGRKLPGLLAVLQAAGAAGFYRNDGSEFLGSDGAYHPVPGE